ncbi:lactose permease, partial [Plectosphaerella plurivora]
MLVETSTASVALAAALADNKPGLLSRQMMRLYGIMVIGYLVSTINGFDGSLMGAVNAMKPYHETFGLTGAGASTGIVFIVYNIGQIISLPISPYISDGYGRRKCIFIGCFVILIGTAIQTTANTTGHFIAGRLVLGLGAAVAQATGPIYAVELAHPAHRGLLAGMYNNFWWVGNILAGWVTYGTNLHLTTSWAWRIPTLLQAAMPAIVMSGVLFLPESPRWLISKDRTEEALAVLTKYHGEGDINAPIVQLQYQEIIEDRARDDSDNRWWDFRELVRDHQSRWRTYIVVVMSFFAQWSGNNVVSYFMPAMVENAGITDSNTQLLLNAINPILSMAAAVTGAFFLDKFGRRPMMMGALTGSLVFYILLTAFSAQVGNHANLSYAVIVSIYLYGICFASGMTPCQALYPTECLENRTRAKGTSLKFLCVNIAMMVNTYGISIGIKKITWRLYLVFVIWLAIEIVVIYFTFPETAGKTLEELTSIFEAKNPRKESLKKTKVLVDDGGNV